MKIEDKEYIMNNKDNYSQDNANKLVSIAQRYDGPKINGCLCKSDVINRYIDNFYKFYDLYLLNQTNNDK